MAYLETKCIRYDTCPSSKSFWVGWNNPRFPYAIRGEVQSYCPCMDYEPEVKTLEVIDITMISAMETEWSVRQWDRVEQLKGMVLHLQGKLEKHLEKKKPGVFYNTIV